MRCDAMESGDPPGWGSTAPLVHALAMQGWHAESIEPVHARTLIAVAEETLVTVVVTPDASVVVVVVTVVVGVGYIDQTTRNQGECAHAQSMQIVVVSATDKS